MAREVMAPAAKEGPMDARVLARLPRMIRKLLGAIRHRSEQAQLHLLAAVVAVSRKLAVLLHRLWVTGEVYEPLRNSSARTAEKKTAA